MSGLFENAPEYVYRYLMYAVTLQGKSPKTIEEYYYDIRMFLKYYLMMKRAAEVESNTIQFDIGPDQPMNKAEEITKKRKRKPSEAKRLKEKEKLDAIKEEDITEGDILEVKKNDIEEFMYFLANKLDVKEAARSRKVSSIRSFYNYLHIDLKVIAENPAASVAIPKKKKTVPVHLTLNEAEDLLDHITKDTKNKFKSRNYCIVTLFLNIGMRLEELVNIDMTDIKNNTIVITGKGNKERTVPLNKACLKAIEHYLPDRIIPPNGSKDRNALFTSKQKKRISRRMVQDIIEKSIQGAKLSDKYTTHKLRHTAATLIYQNGKDIRALQDLLGHENLSSTQIYTHVNDEQVKAAVESNPLNKYGGKHE
ncbi:MAG: tyrosine recombinase XerC [Eubacteriales bacterium]|nr:tyrosine recombinase XerC [Eubacteriales bacterium]